MGRQHQPSVGTRKGPKPTAATVSNRGTDDRYWSLLHAVLNTAPIPDKDRIRGFIRSRNLGLIAEACEEGSSAAVQQGNHGLYIAYASLRTAFSKYEGHASPSGEVAALSTWRKAERSCARANRRIRLTGKRCGFQYVSVLERARCIVHAILGVFSFGEMAENARHGPGVALGLSGLATSGAFKYAHGVYTVSPSCATIFRDLVLTDPTWNNMVWKHNTRLEVVDDCEKLSFVPKNWKTRRTIGVGPLGNVFTQLGVGEMMVSRLKRHGIDLQDQSNNQRAALQASLHSGRYGDDYVTIDLSSASDTLCRELVKFLVPEDWYRVMNVARSQWALLPDGSRVWLSKFSAMGNGFTFPLETLVFYALSQACMADTVHHNRVWVYGDDIIVPRGCSLWLSEVLRWVGFSVNFEKSFFHGDFYESCGTDYLGGVPVRPVYWKRSLCSDRDVYVLVNSYTEQLSGLPYRDWMHDLRDHLLRSCRDPVLFGPGVVSPDSNCPVILDDRVVTDDRSLWKLSVRRGITYCKVFRTAPRRKPVHDDWAYLQVKHSLQASPGVAEKRIFRVNSRHGSQAPLPNGILFAVNQTNQSLARCTDSDRKRALDALIAPLGSERDAGGNIRVAIRSTTSGTCRISVS